MPEFIDTREECAPHTSQGCFKSPTVRKTPSHAGILQIILDAKDNGHIWADSALAEIGQLMGVHYIFARQKGFNRHEIEVLG